MTFDEKLAIYMKLIREFCDGIIQAPEFDRKYYKFWEQCRDEEHKLYIEFREQDPQYKVERALPFMERDLRSTRRFIGLKPEYEQKINRVLDRICTASDCYYEDISDEELDPPGVINDRMLLEEVRGMLKEIEDILAKKDE